MTKMMIEIDTDAEVLTIAGVRYTYALFERLGFDAVGTVLRIDKRDDASVTLSKHEPPYATLTGDRTHWPEALAETARRWAEKPGDDLLDMLRSRLNDLCKRRGY